ncbi:MAG: imidazole glycerol phosphate synthase subunit HisH [Pseudomonadota bacterium]
METIVIIDYGSGNLHSAAKAFERAGREAGLSLDIAVTGDPERVAKADRVVLPGVGAFADCRAGLLAVDGLTGAIDDAVNTRAVPFCGICVGMQLLATRGLEHGETPGFDWIAGNVTEIVPAAADLKIPHMGWNTLARTGAHPLFDDLPLGSDGWHAYFVHSYHLEASSPEHIIATTDHGGPITAVVARDNIVGTQFHPEKSQQLGLAFITNFLRWRP